VCVVLLVHSCVQLHAIARNSVTIDEFAHVPAGVAYWRQASFFLYHHNPPLIKLAASLPVAVADANFTSLPKEAERDGGQHWRVGRKFMHDNQRSYIVLVQRARYPVLIMSVLAGWFIWLWGRDLWGNGGGFLAVAMWCLIPDVLAHGGLATVDLGATAVGLIACYAFWRWLRAPSWAGSVATGVLLGLALLSKFTTMLLPATWMLIWLIARGCERLRGRVSMGRTEHRESYTCAGRAPFQQPLLKQMAQAIAGSAASLAIVNTGYGFQNTCQPLGNFPFVSSLLRGRESASLNWVPSSLDQPNSTRNRFSDSWLASVPVPLPAEFVLGIDEQFQHAEPRPANTPGRFTFYLNGVRSRQGWWYYYLLAMFLKTPTGILALLFTAIAAALCSRDYRADAASELLLAVVPLAIIAGMSFATEINIGVRYVLPAWPFLILATARLGRSWTIRDPSMAVIVACWFSWAAISTLLVHPHYLSYFNEIAGGPNAGWRCLADSNIDWGQDLLELRDWVRDNANAQPMHIAYAGTVDPHVVGLQYELPPGSTVTNGEWERAGPQPGWFAVSANLVVGLPFWITDEAGTHRPTHEDEFGYFRLFEPVAKAGYSIFIYHIMIDEANEARRKLGLPPIGSVTADHGEGQ
jgi:hypothetical protein